MNMQGNVQHILQLHECSSKFGFAPIFVPSCRPGDQSQSAASATESAKLDQSRLMNGGPTSLFKIAQY